MPFRPVACLALFLGIACVGCERGAEDAAACVPVVRDGWLRPAPAGMPMLAGFARITNECAVPVEIVAIRSDGFSSVELHETRIEDGISRMRRLPALRIEAGESAVLQPGGMHLMLMQPQASATGKPATIEFELADGRRLRGEFPVSAGPTPPAR